MSNCSTNQTDTTTAFNAASYASSLNNISLLEETQSSLNTCRLTSVRGKIKLDLTAFPRGRCTVYFKVDPQSDGISNTPPTTADSMYHAVLTSTMGIINTSGYYANRAPTFSASNNCAASDKQLGWAISDVIGAIQPSFRYDC